MMKKIKGCLNESCEAHIKKRKFKESETFCSKCGSPLSHVCKDCFMKSPEDNDKYCVRCHANHEDRKDKDKKVAAGVISVGLAVGGVMFKYGKKAFDVVKNFKG